MFAETLNSALLSVLDRPDLRVVADRQRINFDAMLDTPFRAEPDGEVVLGAACSGPERVCAFHLRHALELSMLLDAATRLPFEPADAPGAVRACDLPILAGLCAARTAALFWRLDEEPDGAGTPGALPAPASWVAMMAADAVPDDATLVTVWRRVRDLQGASCRLLRAELVGQDESAVPAAVRDRLFACWSLLGPAETLMARGGDARLAVDPRTGLNHYGCSHRPRPWAVTFASSTASSLSERGFGGAETARKRLAVAALSGQAAALLRDEAANVRAAIAAHYGLPDGCGIVLAPSGTDCELTALAAVSLPQNGQPAAPVSNILVAPDETGTGVPLAAAGRHFAADTARGHSVQRGTSVDGFDPGTVVLPVALRDADGQLRPPAAVDADCAAVARADAAKGRQVLMHRLDLSKTGLLAPGLPCLDALQEELGERFSVVVDACQARLDAERVRDYLRRGWMVMVTGSKFFTGPPFCGAVLLPEPVVARLQAATALPDGLRAYTSRTDWPDAVSAADALHPEPNLGMVLRWSAALAEMRAFAAVPPARLLHGTRLFLRGIGDAVEAHPDLLAVEVPPPVRDGRGSWDEEQLIRSILVLEPGAEGADRRPLDMARARALYRWLNADISSALPADAPPDERTLGRLLCHLGQPAPVAHPALPDGPAGALRISVGARLLSGEPSHEGLDADARLRREVRDVGRVLNKIALILRHWDTVAALDPVPTFSAGEPSRRRADPGLNI